MRILSAGIQPPSEWEQKCRKCGTIFAWDEADIIKDNHNPTPTDTGVRLVCPVCKAWLAPDRAKAAIPSGQAV